MSKADSSTLKLNIKAQHDDNKPGIVVFFFELILSTFAFIGFGGMFIRLTGLSVNAIIVFAVSMLSCFILLLPVKKLSTARLFVPIIAVVAMGIITWKSIANGFVHTANNVIDIIGRRFERIIPHVRSIGSNTGSESYQVTLFLVAVAILISYSIVFSVRHKDIIIPLILSAVTVTICVVLCFAPPLWYIGSACLYIFGIAISRLSGSKVGVISFSACTVTCVALSFILLMAGINSPDFSDIRSYIISTADSIRYGKSAVMPEGDFSALNGFNPSGKKQLEVIMTKPDSLYLKGFVGEEYNGKGWESIKPAKRYQSADMFYWLHEADFYGQNQLSLASQIDDNDTINNITINNIGASRKYIYYPYEIVSGGVFDKASLSDGVIKADGFSGEKLYTINALENKVKCYPDILNALKDNRDSGAVTSYLNNESHYKAFVYDTYLDIPETARNVLRNQLGEYSDDGRLDYKTAQQNILSYLSSKVSYNADVAFSAKNGDFLQCFLEQTCEGYSVHYATAATLMFRYYGIPARYVEGYLVTPDDVKDTVSNTALNIDDRHFHAWTEFYRDGIGWIPFEATPPYLNVMEKAEELTAIPDKSGDDTDDKAGSHDKQKSSGLGEMLSTEIVHKSARTIEYALLIALVAVILAFVLVCAVRCIHLNNRYRMIEKADNRQSVLLAFSYITCLLKKQGYIKHDNDFYSGDTALSDDIKTSLRIYEKARFSKHDITDSERQAVLSSLDTLVYDIKSKNGFIKNTYYRFVKCSYK